MTVEAQSPVDEKQLLTALGKKIPRVKVGAGYKAGLLLVTAVMVLLPVVYLAVILLAGYGVAWYAVHGAAIFETMHGASGMKVALFLYLAPLAAGAVLVLFMIKPLFAGRAQRPAPFTLSRSEQRVLYTFVDRLCDVVGSRKPCRIDIDCAVNASAGFRDGLPGLITGELVLTIGLPLVGGMTLPQLTGVLAHEFGHFAQGTGMRLTFIVRSIDAWFARVVYQRDSWDEWLVGVSKSDAHLAINAMAGLARFMVWLTRRVLWLLMVTGRIVSSFMLRQMEFDADRYEARVAGSDTFQQTSERLVMLNVASTVAYNDLGGAWREKRLCDDLPGLIVAREGGMPEQVRLEVRKHAGKAKTGVFDSHPSDAARIASARRENATGIFRVNGPASMLFEDFAGLSRRVTEMFYRENLGAAFHKEHLVTTETMVGQQQKRKEAVAALQRVFQDLISPVRPVFPRRGVTVKNHDQAAERMLLARNRLADQLAAARAAEKTFDEADTKMLAALRIHTKTRHVPVGAGVKEELTGLAREANVKREQSLALLNKVLTDAMERVEICLALEQQDRRRRAAENAAAQSDGEGAYDLAAEEEQSSGDAKVDALLVLSAAWEKVEAVRLDYHRLAGLLSLLKPRDNAEELVGLVIARGEQLHARLMECHATLRRGKYPYAHAERTASISRFALEQIPARDDVLSVFRAAESTLEAVFELYIRLMSDLAERVESVEAEMGLEKSEIAT